MSGISLGGPVRMWVGPAREPDAPPPTAAELHEDFTRLEDVVGVQLTPWQRRVAAAVLDPRVVISYPRQAGRSTISRHLNALNGAPMPASRDLHITITPHLSAVRAALLAAAEAAHRTAPAVVALGGAWTSSSDGLTWAEHAKRVRRCKIEQRRIRQAMRHIERRAARRQRRAASRAARSVAR